MTDSEYAAHHEAELLQEMARLALSSLLPHELAQRVVQVLRERFGALTCTLWLFEGQSRQLVREACVGPVGGPIRSDGLALTQAEERLLGTDTLTVVNDLDAAGSPDGLDIEGVVGEGANSYAVVPLNTGAGPLGVLVLAWAGSHTFTEAETRLIEGASGLLALGFENARLYAKEQRARALNESLNRISETVLASGTPDQIVKGSVLEAVQAFGADKALVAIKEGNMWTIVAGEGFPEEIIGARYPDEDVPGMVLVARTRTPHLIGDAVADPLASSRFNLAHFVASEMLLPLIVGGGVFGVLSCGFLVHREFNDEDMFLAQRASLVISLGYETAVLLRERAQAVEHAEDLQAIQTILLSTEDLAGAIEGVLAKAAQHVNAEAGLIVTGLDAKWEFGARYDPSDALSREPLLGLVAESLAGNSAESGTSALRDGTVGDGAGIAMASIHDPVEPAKLLFLREEGDFDAAERDYVAKLADGLGVARREQRIRHEREWLSKSRGQWLSGISHDLRTPLASIRGYAELLADEYVTPPEETRRQGAIIVKQTERIQGLVDDLLLTFRIREGALPMTLESADLVRLLEEVASATKSDLHYGPGQLRIVGETGKHIAVVDCGHLVRALKNIVTNAFVHNPDGTHVTLAVTSAVGVEEVMVSDDGMGMDEAQLARIWTRYESGLDASDDRTGIGLGMSVSRQLVESMGGSIGITSAPGGGTSVVVTLIAGEPDDLGHPDVGGGTAA